jgi:hypothetical protein
MCDDLLAERAAIEQAGTLGGERLEGFGEIRLADDVAQRHRLAGVGLHPLVTEREWFEQRQLLVDLGDAELRQREAVARQRDRGLQRLAERLLAVAADQLGPAGEISRRRD